jgi:hypothetical protein
MCACRRDALKLRSTSLGIGASSLTTRPHIRVVVGSSTRRHLSGFCGGWPDPELSGKLHENGTTAAPDKALSRSLARRPTWKRTRARPLRGVRR